MPRLLDDEALRGEAAALPEGGVLTAAALGQEQRAQPPAALAGGPPLPPPRPGTGRAWKTGVGGSLPGRRDDGGVQDTLLAGLQKGLDLTRDALKRYGTKEGREEDALNKAFQEAFEAMVKAEGEKLIEAAPFGKVILVSFDLSLAFAEGVGKALDKVNADLARKYDFSRLGEEIDEETFARIQAMRGYQAEATRQLGRVVAEGLAEVAAKATEMVLEKLGEIPGKVLDDVAGQVARQLVRQNDLLAISRQAVEEAAGSIPAGRGKVERLAFHFVSSVFLAQMADKELQKKLAGLPAVAKSGPVDVNLLASALKMLVQGSYDTYARHVDVAYAQTEAKQLLLESVRRLAAGLVGVRLEASGSGDVEVAPDRIGVPATLLPSLVETAEASTLMRDRWWGREKELIDYLRRLRLWLDSRKAGYQRQWKRHAQGDIEGWAALQNRWADDWRETHRRAQEAIEAIVEEFGEAWHGGTIRTELELDTYPIIGREREVPTFAPRP